MRSTRPVAFTRSSDCCSMATPLESGLSGSFGKAWVMNCPTSRSRLRPVISINVRLAATIRQESGSSTTKLPGRVSTRLRKAP
jgi:hypothetical protein